jgi:arsenical pump membrane protein
MALMIGNPTNIYLMTGSGVSFVGYAAKMLLPTVLAGAVSFILLRLIFAKKLKAPLASETQEAHVEDKTLTALGVAFLGVCIALMVVSSYIDLPMWVISLSCCVALFVCASAVLLFRKKGLSRISDTFKHAPYEIIPFVISMFVLVLALGKVGLTQKISEMLSSADTVFGYGLASFFGANVINNIPMSVLFSSVTESLVGTERLASLYSSVAGSNIGAFLTPVGALAGIMWMSMLKKHGERLSFAGFVGYGVMIALPTMLATLLGLKLVI